MADLAAVADIVVAAMAAVATEAVGFLILLFKSG